MNKKSLLFFAIVSIAMFSMCKKSTSSSSQPISWFKVNDTTYSPGSGGVLYDTAQQMLYFTDSKKDSLTISFLYKPTTGAYSIVNDGTATLTGKNCGVDCLVGGGLIHDYYSIGKPTDSVYITVSSSGKLTATFNNITSKQDGDTSNKVVTVSGLLIQN